MSEKITIRVNDSLKTIFNTDDTVYKSLICDKNGIPETTIVKPIDFNLGVIADNLEYLRRYSIDLLSQILIDQSTGEFLKYQLETFFKNLRLDGETESSWIARAKALVFQPKLSSASLISVLRPYSSVEPEILNGNLSSMYADVSFADRYRYYETTFEGVNFSVYPSYVYPEENNYFSIIIILYDVDSNSLFTIIDLVNNCIAAGINFTIELATS